MGRNASVLFIITTLLNLMCSSDAFLSSTVRLPKCTSSSSISIRQGAGHGAEVRRRKASAAHQCRMSSTDADGDQSLAKAASALAEGRFEEATTMLQDASRIYREANVHDRDELIAQIAQKVAEGKAQASWKSRGSGGTGAASSVIRMSKQEGDIKMQEATTALGRRDLQGAMLLLDEAADLFQQAGFAIARDREAVLGNLRSSVMIELERDELVAKRASRKVAEEAEERRMLGLGEAVAAAALYGSIPQSDDGGPGEWNGQDVCILIDNGSSRPASTVALRDVARRLEEKVGGGLRVVPASLKHSDKAPVEQLGGEPALLLDGLVGSQEFIDAGRLTMLPLFLGPSRAVLDGIPAAAEVAQSMGLECSVAGHVGMGDDGVAMLAKVMLKEVERLVKEKMLDAPAVILVDHGSPSRQVTKLRDDVAAAMRDVAVQSGLATSVTPASMERGEGERFAFADPLLAACLPGIAASSTQGVIICLMFIGPGTHAGPGGDIDQICEEALANIPGGKVYRTKLLGECDGLLDILEHRLHQAGALQR